MEFTLNDKIKNISFNEENKGDVALFNARDKRTNKSLMRKI